MITREERDLAADMINHRLIDTLQSWMDNEKSNLSGFINNPQGHVDFNEYLEFNIPSLRQRVGMLGAVSSYLSIISKFKNGEEGVTRSMHDNAVDSIPNIIWSRLYEWTRKRATDMYTAFEKAKNTPPVPLTDYRSAATLNEEKYLAEIEIFRVGAESLKVVIDFASQPKVD